MSTNYVGFLFGFPWGFLCRFPLDWGCLSSPNSTQAWLWNRNRRRGAAGVKVTARAAADL